MNHGLVLFNASNIVELLPIQSVENGVAPVDHASNGALCDGTGSTVSFTRVMSGDPLAVQWLDNGDIEALVTVLRSLLAHCPAIAGKLETEAQYFERNAEKMRYPQFRAPGLFAGSGVIQAGCNRHRFSSQTVRMFWTIEGANRIIALRCCRMSGKFEDFWEARAA